MPKLGDGLFGLKVYMSYDDDGDDYDDDADGGDDDDNMNREGASGITCSRAIGRSPWLMHGTHNGAAPEILRDLGSVDSNDAHKAIALTVQSLTLAPLLAANVASTIFLRDLIPVRQHLQIQGYRTQL